jgi:hypothetical protein
MAAMAADVRRQGDNDEEEDDDNDAEDDDEEHVWLYGILLWHAAPHHRLKTALNSLKRKKKVWRSKDMFKGLYHDINILFLTNI